MLNRSAAGSCLHSRQVFTSKDAVHRNEPNVHKEAQKDNAERWHGAELSVTILGNWQYYRSKVLKWAPVTSMPWMVQLKAA